MFFITNLHAQNSLVGDGFGGRLWYQPFNYTVGSYSAFTICGENKQLYGWGGTGFGELGNGTNGSDIPIAIPNMDSVYYYSTGYVMGAIKMDKSGWVWGFNVSANPIKVLDSVKFVDAGAYNCAFVKEDGTVWSVGTNYNGEFGNGIGGISTFIIPQKMLNINNAVRTAQGFGTTCVLLKDSTVWCAGSNIKGALGNNSADTAKSLMPTKVSFLQNIIDIKANALSNLALDRNGNIWLWGDNFLNGKIYTPIQLTVFNKIVAISGSNDGDHFFVLDSAKNCYAIGVNTYGQCGTGSSIFPYLTKMLVATNVVDIMAGETFSYIVKADNTIWATGRSFGNSIWLNLPNQQRFEFTEINPKVAPFNLCDLNGTFPPSIYDSIKDIIFPNAFSPNNDLVNDTYKPIILPDQHITKYNFAIYDRWGEKVFSTTDKYAGWDGKQNNMDAPIATYFYMVNYENYGKNKKLKGDLILIR